jgi:hypothetical protein
MGIPEPPSYRKVIVNCLNDGYFPRTSNLLPLTSNLHLEPYPKAMNNPITAPKVVLMYGLQVKPQVLPILAEIRLRP